MLRARQTRFFSRFTYDLFDENSNQIGTITWPEFAVAKNARLKDAVPKSFSTQLKIEVGEHSFVIEFEYLNRSWSNNIRFTLKEGEAILASAEVLQQKWARPSIRLISPLEGSLVSQGNMFAARYALIQHGAIIGTLFETSSVSLKREIFIDLPDWVDKPTQAFIFFLMMNHAFR